MEHLYLEVAAWHTANYVQELFSWKTTSHKDHLEVFLPISRLLSGLYGMWSSMKIIPIVSSEVRMKQLCNMV